MHVVLDFDGTMTQEDTIGALASYGVHLQEQRQNTISPNAWAEIVQKYSADYEQYATGHEPQPDARTTLEEEVAFQRGLRGVELRSIGRVRDSGLFQGVHPSGLFLAGQDAVRDGRVRLRHGFKEFVHIILGAGLGVTIVSVNWSASFIRGIVGEPDIDVIANEINEDGDVEGPRAVHGAGQRGPVLVTSGDKREAMKAAVAGDRDGPVLYFGDSATDLECLAAAGTGVVMSDTSDGKLLRVLRRLGFSVPHVSQAADKSSGSRQLAWAEDFSEVLQAGIVGPFA